MGACFIAKTLDGTLTTREVKEKFRQMQSDDQYENGHSYSGGFGCLLDLTVLPDKIFDTYSDAEDWLDSNCVKWENAKAVRYHDFQTKRVKQPTFNGEKNYSQWKCFFPVLGSTHKIKVADQLEPSDKRNLLGLWACHHEAARTWQGAKSKFDNCMALLSKLLDQFDDWEELKKLRQTARTAMLDFIIKQDNLKKEDERLGGILYAEETTDKGERWMIGGNCPS